MEESEKQPLEAEENDNEEREEGFAFFKGDDESAAEQSEVIHFQPSKEHYENPQELVEEYRDFIQNDLEEGQVVHVQPEHAAIMAAHHKKQAAQQQRIAESGGESKTEDSDEWIEGENDLAKLDRAEIAQILAEQIAMDTLLFMGGAF